MTPSPVLVWFRRDLRQADNPALAAAAATGQPVLPVYIFDETDPWAPGGAARWWLHESLASLGRSLEALGSRLILAKGNPAAILPALIAQTGARMVTWNRLYDPHARARDTALKATLKQQGIAVESFNGTLLAEPWEIRTGAGTSYLVFTPFWKALSSSLRLPPALPAPRQLASPENWPESEALESWALKPSKPDWAAGFSAHWQPGEAGASRRLDDFLAHAAAGYKTGRDYPAQPGTSGLSPHLHIGEIGPRQIWHRTEAAMTADGIESGGMAYLREVGWREFCHHLLYHRPDLPEANLKPEFDAFPWLGDAEKLKAWQRGRTGYPIIDAGMRELWQTGWMHNRVRMIAASFLIKDLAIDWRQGQAWFWYTLVDADLANNAAGWQWVAGSGADAAPFFRIFNPVLQSQKFDGQGSYIRRFVPELAGLPPDHIHAPWAAPAQVLIDAGVRLGETYPLPIVDHALARDRALAAYKIIRSHTTEAAVN